ncbi:MAG: uracil-DNA glycosylase [Phycisphaerae bacterium]
MADPLQQLRSFVRQSAETARLLDVDFIPVYRCGVLDVTLPDIEPAAATVPTSPQVLPRVAPAASTSVGTRPAAAEPPPRPTLPATPRQTPAAVPKPPAAILAVEAASASEPWPDPIPADQAASRGEEARHAAMAALQERYGREQPHRHFKPVFHNIVWGEGDVRATLMFIGEAPGEDEDLQGRPFVGRSGQLLDKMIVAMGIERSSLYIANVLKARPDNNKFPPEAEAAPSLPYLLEQIAIVGPTLLVTLGLAATRMLLGTESSMSDLRGRWSELTIRDGRRIPVMPTYHPSYVLRSYTEEVRGKVWSDLKMVMERLKQP